MRLKKNFHLKTKLEKNINKKNFSPSKLELSIIILK